MLSSVYTSAELLRVPSRPLKPEGGFEGAAIPPSPAFSCSFLVMHHCFLRRKRRGWSLGEKSLGPCFKRLSHF